MMFLVIFGSLAAAMAIVAQGNLATADSSMKINRSLAAAETGLHFMVYRVNQITANVQTRDGEITSANAGPLWDQVRAGLIASLSMETHNLTEPYECIWPQIDMPVSGGKSLHVGPMGIGPGAPTFTATFTPHPIAGENYDSSYYQRSPYVDLTPVVSNATPLDGTWVRVRIEAFDGPINHRVTRAVQLDFQLEKKIRYAILSRSRVMIGRNVMIEGPIGSRYNETHLTHGHPIQMLSDFGGLDTALDANLTLLKNTLATNDANGDNRVNLADSREIQGITNPAQYDIDGDGFVDDYDFFLAHYDTSAKGYITAVDMNTSSNVDAAQLFTMIDTFGDPNRTGYGDGRIDEYDRYTKVRGEIRAAASKAAWEIGAANGPYQDFFQGPIQPDYNGDAMTFEAADTAVPQFTPADFDVASFKAMAANDLATQAVAQAANHDPSDPTSPQPLGNQTREAVPFGAAHPYDYYDRPIYENMTFTNIRIPKGSNALFKNCRFIGVTFVETESNNQDALFSFAGMQEADGTAKHPNLTVKVNGQDVADTKTISNNVRFHGCTFEGGIVSDAPTEFSQTRNKIAFTGKTAFKIKESTELNAAQKALFRRSTLLVPHYSVEMGTFVSPADSNETVELSGTVVAGIIDMRGQVKVNGTILTTFEPKSNTGPVQGDTSPQFNTTLGYFSSLDGDMEAELPSGGRGIIQVRYDPTLPLPDGILAPISLRPNYATYSETGAR